MDAFTEFEHQGWERVAHKYDSTWSSSTRRFIEPLLDTTSVGEGMAMLDVGCATSSRPANRADCILRVRSYFGRA